MLGSRMTTWPDNIFVAIMTTIHGMIMMVAIICPGCHTAFNKGVKNEFIHSQFDIASLLLFLTPITVLCMISRSDSRSPLFP